MWCVTAAVLPGSNGGHEYPREPERRAARPRHGRGSLLLPASAEPGLPRQDLDLRAVIRYLADYAAALCRSATYHTPDKPGPTAQELLASVAMIVSLSVPRPD